MPNQQKPKPGKPQNDKPKNDQNQPNRPGASKDQDQRKK